MFEFWNNPENLTLALVVGPGPEGVRQKLFEIAARNLGAFEEPWKAAGAWYVIYQREFLSGIMYENVTDAEREAEIRKNWADFLENDLPRIDAALKKEAWIREPED